MISALKLGHIGVFAQRYEEMLDYFTKVLGLQLVEHTPTTSYLRVGVDPYAVSLHRHGSPGLQHVALLVDPKYSTADIVKDLAGAGISGRVETDADPWTRELVSFTDLDGARVELHTSVDYPRERAMSAGIAPLKIGHIARGVVDVKATCAYYERVLGFRVSDWMEDFFVFMRCSPDHHTLNFIATPAPMLHHVAFQVSDWAHVQRACDRLAEHDMPLMWGPIRHGIGHSVSIYHLNPDGGRVELFCELDLMLDERLGYFEPRPWHEDNPQRPKVWKLDTLRARAVWGMGPPPGWSDRR